MKTITALVAGLALAGMITPASAQISFQFGIQPDYGYAYQAPVYSYPYQVPAYSYPYPAPVYGGYNYGWQRPRYYRGW